MVKTIHQRVDELRKHAAERYGIKPEQCHVGHLMLEGMLEKPMQVNQIDAATDTREANISLAMRTMRLASAMHSFGLKVGDVVFIIGRGHLDMSVPFYATHYMGYTLCTMDPEIDDSDIRRLYATIKPKVTFTIQYSLEKVNNALTVNNINSKVIVFEDKENNLETFIHKYKGTVIDFSPATGFNTAEVPAWFMLTSGTTGPPKPAIIPYDLVLNAAIEWWDGEYDFSSSMILTSPQWLTTLVFTMSAPIKGFTRIQSSQCSNPQILLHMINKYRPEATAWTPYLLARFVQGPQNTCDLSCFKHIIVGGAAVERNIVVQFRKICTARIYACYGMSELLVVAFKVEVISNIPYKSTGQAMDKYQYRLVGENGDEITEPNKNGELWMKGYGFFAGYLNDLEETRNVLTEDGWLKTGDIFYRDENNYYYYVERKKLLIRYLTFLLSPLEIEDVIRKHPGVADVCVVGIPNPSTMEHTVAAIMRKPGHDFEPQEIFDLVNSELSEKKHLHGGLFFVDSFPVTVSSKVNRSKVLYMAKEVSRIMPK